MKPRVLVVDHDEAITRQLFWTLCDEYEVMTANDLQTAVRRATIYEPDVTILDLQARSSNSPDAGMRILDYIRSRVPHSKVLVMTSASNIAIQKDCHALGVDQFLYKPFDTERLLAALRRLAPAQHLDAV